MDMDVFGVDELLDFSNDDQLLISSTSSASTTTTTTTIATTDSHHHHFTCLDNPATPATNIVHATSVNFTDYLCVPNDDIAELEWLSKFVDDSFTDYPAYSVTGTMNIRSDTSFNSSSSKTKRSRSTPTFPGNTIADPNNKVNDGNIKETATVMSRRERSPASSSSSSNEMLPRRCTHCSSEKTPQWRTGPLGPKTLCNACGVRYKSGRLVPEYRPAASPTFVLTQHSNSHRKVMELRRQKELFRQQQHEQEWEQQQEIYGHRHRRFQVC